MNQIADMIAPYRLFCWIRFPFRLRRLWPSNTRVYLFKTVPIVQYFSSNIGFSIKWCPLVKMTQWPCNILNTKFCGLVVSMLLIITTWSTKSRQNVISNVVIFSNSIIEIEVVLIATIGTCDKNLLDRNQDHRRVTCGIFVAWYWRQHLHWGTTQLMCTRQASYCAQFVRTMWNPYHNTVCDMYICQFEIPHILFMILCLYFIYMTCMRPLGHKMQ